MADLDDPTAPWRPPSQQANEAASPTDRLTSVEAAYWTSVGNREYLRWVLPDDEDRVLDGLARLHAADAEHLVDGDRLIGMFRAHGLVAPVWDLPARAPAPRPSRSRPHGCTQPCATRWTPPTPLTSEERSARAGLASRQLTIR